MTGGSIRNNRNLAASAEHATVLIVSCKWGRSVKEGLLL